MSILAEEDLAIIGEYLQGDRERGATTFIRKYQRFVYSVVSRNLADRDDVDDGVQEVFIRALNGLNSFRGESKVTTWLYSIAIHVCKGIRRKKRTVRFFQFDSNEESYEERIADSELTPDKTLVAEDFMTRFMQMVTKLPERQKETFMLRHFDERSYEEISEMTGTSVGGLKANYFHAINKLGEMLKASEFASDYFNQSTRDIKS